MAVSIRLTAASASHDVKLGSSKLGGTPDLPEGTMWPQCNGVPMALLAQLRLQDLNPYDTDGWLPKSGILYFFYEAKDQVWGFDPKDRGHWSVIYHDGDLEKLRPTKPPAGLPEECRFQPCELGFHNEITLPSWDSQEVDRLKLSEKEGDTYINLLDAGVGSSHRMFGHPDQVQGDMTLECQLVSHGISTGSPEGFADPRRAALEKGADDWKLLLQVDSDAELGTMWGDSGRIYFWIRDQDLKKRDFSNVWLVLQCY